jgi:hypothetical protein
MRIYRTYPYSHAFWSTVISVIVALAVWQVCGVALGTWWLWVWGGAFYAAREFWQSAKGGFSGFDQPGFWWGVTPSIALAVLL